MCVTTVELLGLTVAAVVERFSWRLRHGHGGRRALQDLTPPE
jgi:hypothetical protein